MISTKEIIKSKKLPTFIKSKPIFKSETNVKKIFPKMGLGNNTTDISLDKLVPEAKSIVSAIKKKLDYYLEDSNDFAYDYDVGSKQSAKFSTITYLVDQINKSLDKAKLVINKNKYEIRFASSIKDHNGKVVYKKGQDALEVLRKIQADLKKSKIHNIYQIDKVLGLQDKKTKTKNKKLKIVFSSEGFDGVWDIATMSMRGISSCQRWPTQNDNYLGHCNKLIGTIVDPYAGIIYITDGVNTKHGPKMLARSVVRVVMKASTPCLLLERIYLNPTESLSDDDDDDDDYDYNIIQDKYFKVFKEYLQSKVGKKVPIFYADTMSYKDKSKISIPNSPVVKKLTNSAPDLISYRDSGVLYKDLPNNLSKVLKNKLTV